MKRLGAGRVDEARKLLQITEILDAERFRAAWRGQQYECRALPGTGTMTVGDQVICHVLPDNTQLIALAGCEEVLPYGLIIIWSGTTLNVPADWRYCNGGGGTPDMTRAMPVCAGPTFPLHDTGGDEFYDVNPSHFHTLTDADGPVTSASHSHSYPAMTTGTEGQNPYISPSDASTNPSLATHTHPISAGTTDTTVHTHAWSPFARNANALVGFPSHNPRYRAFPYIMHTGGDIEIPIGGIINWSGLIANIPAGYALCNGAGGTINMTDRFVICEGSGYVNAETGGNDTSALGHTHAIHADTDITNTLHNHPVPGTTGSGASAGSSSGSGAVNVMPPGSGHSHTFTGTAANLNHLHTISGSPATALGDRTNRPIYYTLAFIQRMT